MFFPSWKERNRNPQVKTINRSPLRRTLDIIARRSQVKHFRLGSVESRIEFRSCSAAVRPMRTYTRGTGRADAFARILSYHLSRVERLLFLTHSVLGWGDCIGYIIS